MEKRKAQNAYTWLWLSPLVTVPTAVLLYRLVLAAGFNLTASITRVISCPPYSTNLLVQRLAVYVYPVLAVFDSAVPCSPYGGDLPCPSAILIGILGASLWHLRLFKQAFDPESRFVRWHGWQALLLAGVGTALLIGFFSFLWFDLSIVFVPVFAVILFVYWIRAPAWGRGQVERGECSLKRWLEKLELLPSSGADQAKESEPIVLAEPRKPLKARRWWTLLPWLPVLALLGWFFYEQALTWTAPAPRWFTSAGGLETTVNCNDLDRFVVKELDVVMVAEPLVNQVTPEQANELIDLVVARYSGVHTWLMWMGGSPNLVWATFPDGQRRLAWSDFNVIKPATGLYSELGGEVMGIYVDATSGEPLMLVSDIAVGDVANGCAGILMGLPLAHLSRNQFFDVFFLGGYLIAWAVLFCLVKSVQYIVSVITRQKGQTAT